MSFVKRPLYVSDPDAVGEASVYLAERSGVKLATALHPDLLSFLAQMKEAPLDHVPVVTTALSAFEAFGPNNNGDGFYERDLLSTQDYPTKGVVRPIGSEVEGERIKIPQYKTFEYFARPFKHHINRPDSPAYGDVIFSGYNDRMRRVELVSLISQALAPDICKRIERYEPVATSMGFKCSPGDRCSRCGNVAPTRLQYCRCLREDMLRILPDGHLVHAENPWGTFFDISFVRVPADRTSRAVHLYSLEGLDGLDRVFGRRRIVKAASDRGPAHRISDDFGPSRELLEKAAQVQSAPNQRPILSADLAIKLGEEDLEIAWKETETKTHIDASGEMAGKVITERVQQFPRMGGMVSPISTGKLADIDKQVPATIEASGADVMALGKLGQMARSAQPMLPKALLRSARGMGVEKMAASFFASGLDLTPEEFQYAALYAEGKDKLAEYLDAERTLVVPSEPMWQKLSIDLDLADRDLEWKIASSGVFPDRSVYRAWVGCRALPTEAREKLAMYGPDGRRMLLPAERMMIRENARIQHAEHVRKHPFSSRMGPAAYLTGLLIGARFLAGETSVSNYLERRPELIPFVAGGLSIASKALSDEMNPDVTAREKLEFVGDAPVVPTPQDIVMPGGPVPATVTLPVTDFLLSQGRLPVKSASDVPTLFGSALADDPVAKQAAHQLATRVGKALRAKRASVRFTGENTLEALSMYPVETHDVLLAYSLLDR